MGSLYPPHFYAHGENPLYRAFGELMAYNNRVCHLINDGAPVPDAALLYGAESLWAGDPASNTPAARYLTQSQVDFHLIPADVFAPTDEYPCSFDGEKLVINGVSYKALVLPECSLVEEHTAEFIKKAAGTFPVLFTNRKPYGIIGKTAEENEAFAKVIEACPVVPVSEAGAYLRQMEEDGKISLETVAKPANDRLTTYHYRTDADTFLILNEMAQDVYQGTLYLKTTGTPVRYRAWENSIEEVAWERVDEETVKVTLEIQPLELCILCCSEEMTDAAKPLAFESEGTVLASMQVTQMDSKSYLKQLEDAGKGLYETSCIVTTEGGKTETVTAPFAGMQIEHPDFAGYYIYETELALEAGVTYQLVMDQVNESAEVFFNGTSLGMKLQAPFTFILPGEAVKETNALRIEVATLAERKVKAMGGDISCMSAPRPLSATGIVGNVTIYKEEK